MFERFRRLVAARETVSRSDVQPTNVQAVWPAWSPLTTCLPTETDRRREPLGRPALVGAAGHPGAKPAVIGRSERSVKSVESSPKSAPLRKGDEKRAAAEEIGIDTDFIERLVDSFYTKIRNDELLSPIFAERIADWPAHLTRMKGFWRSVLHNSGEFSGNPMVKHLALPGLDLTHFSHWLELFYETLRDMETYPAATKLVGARARMIADSLLTTIAMRQDGLAGGRAGKDLPHA